MRNAASIVFVLAGLLLLAACDMDKNHSMCAQLGMCPEEKPDNDPMCEHYGTCKKEDGEDDSKDEKPHETAPEQQ